MPATQINGEEGLDIISSLIIKGEIRSLGILVADYADISRLKEYFKRSFARFKNWSNYQVDLGEKYTANEIRIGECKVIFFTNTESVRIMGRVFDAVYLDDVFELAKTSHYRNKYDEWEDTSAGIDSIRNMLSSLLSVNGSRLFYSVDDRTKKVLDMLGAFT